MDELGVVLRMWDGAEVGQILQTHFLPGQGERVLILVPDRMIIVLLEANTIRAQVNQGQ